MTDRDELLSLLSVHAETPLAPDQQQRLSQLLRSNHALIDTYVEFMSIHGLLTWDIGAVVPPAADGRPEPIPESRRTTAVQSERSKSRLLASSLAVAVCAIVASLLYTQQPASVAPQNVVVTPQPEGGGGDMITERNMEGSTGTMEPLVLQNHRPATSVATPLVPDDQLSERVSYLPENFGDHEVTTRIDELIDEGLRQNDVTASPVADDAEWLRRVYLTMTGRIPTIEEARTFISDDNPRKRIQLIDQVLKRPESSVHLAVVWTNLLVGRTPRNHVNRTKLHEFLMTSFSENRPWIDTVGELITARGRNDRNGATNFLLAHLNNDATPATAVTARLFLGEQISCVQCHDHPFAKGVSQKEYWALNAFFKDTNRVSVPIANAGSDRMDSIPWRLVDRQSGDRMTHFETRSGRQQAVLPEYDGHTISADSSADRRTRLAELLAADSDAKVARAMVNRMWSHFFGYGFTPQVDDMGPHVAVSHPELLDLLTEAFVKSGYDLHRLMTWMASSTAWQRTSRMTADNQNDRPEQGDVPYFSRVYLRRMTPEEVYESVRVAVTSFAGIPLNPAESLSRVTSEHRNHWVQQFAHAYDTDENDEAVGFDGTISQAMVMMNGTEVTDAIRQATESLLKQHANRRLPVSDTLDRVALAMLTRQPTEAERAVFQSHYRRTLRQSSPSVAMPQVVEDMMWAYLNSSEFVLIH